MQLIYIQLVCVFSVLLVSDTVKHDLEFQGCSTSWKVR